NTLCRVLDGAAISYRTMYKDLLLSHLGARPIILNGMDEDVIWRTDLLDRALHIRRPRLPHGKNKDQAVITKALDAERGKHLGRLLDIVSSGLAHYPSTPDSGYGRMAQLERWMEACSPALGWKSGEFSRLMANQRGEHDGDLLDKWALWPYLKEAIIS